MVYKGGGKKQSLSSYPGVLRESEKGGFRRHVSEDTVTLVTVKCNWRMALTEATPPFQKRGFRRLANGQYAQGKMLLGGIREMQLKPLHTH